MSYGEPWPWTKQCGCHTGAWWGVVDPPRCAFHQMKLYPVPTITPMLETPPQGWECPRCHTVNAPHAMTCHGQECGGAK